MLPVKQIQKWMHNIQTDVFIINRTDEFLSEYISPYAERLQWLSGFSGSAGRAIIEKNRAYIFVDGRYTNQVEQEIDKTLFTIKHLKDYWTHLQLLNQEQKHISLDPKHHSIIEIEKMQEIYLHSDVRLNFIKKNPIDLYWEDQPEYPKSLTFLHPEKFSGESAINKITKIQKKLTSTFIDFFVLSSLDSIAWLLNIRGDDVEFTPLVCSYIIISNEGKVHLFIDKLKIKNFEYFESITIIYPFEEIDNFLDNLDKNKIIGLDSKECSYHFKNKCLLNGLSVKYLENPCLYPKAQKNKVELEGARQANMRDGVSVTKFLYWLKNKISYEKINEINAANYLLKLREGNDLFHSPSFDTISAIGYDAALPHYRVSKESNQQFVNNSIYLVDSGAQYLDGTTDITRTVILGKPSEEQKDRFTRVLKGHIAIATHIFKKNTKGSSIDHLARQSLAEINCDYDHGTGHGIGSFLSVHEGPQRIAKYQGQIDGFIKDGMIISNEPGYYKKGEYGIRIENLLISSFLSSDKMYFETISWAPIDVDLIDASLLTDKEIRWLNSYHSDVYNRISPNLNQEEKEWLKKVTASL